MACEIVKSNASKLFKGIHGSVVWSLCPKGWQAMPLHMRWCIDMTLSLYSFVWSALNTHEKFPSGILAFLWGWSYRAHKNVGWELFGYRNKMQSIPFDNQQAFLLLNDALCWCTCYSNDDDDDDVCSQFKLPVQGMPNPLFCQARRSIGVP